MKIVFVKRRLLALSLCAVTALGIFCAAWLPSTARAYAANRPLPIYCVDKDQKVCSISFDAAWGNEDTQTLIDILDKYQVKTTFFVVGNWVTKYPESVKALADAGHEVMSHSDNHAHYNALSAGEIAADLNAANEKIEAVTGVQPTLVRCPYGEYDNHVVTAVRALGMEPIQWDVERPHTVESPCSASAGATMWGGGMFRLGRSYAVPGGTDMKIKHTHPVYTSERERLKRLQELKKECISKLVAVRGGKTA